MILAADQPTFLLASMALGKFSKALLNEIDVSSALAGSSVARQYGLDNNALVDHGSSSAGHGSSDFLYNSTAGPSSTRPSKVPFEYEASSDPSWVAAERFPEWLSNESSWTFAPSDLEGGENLLVADVVGVS